MADYTTVGYSRFLTDNRKSHRHLEFVNTNHELCIREIRSASIQPLNERQLLTWQIFSISSGSPAAKQDLALDKSGTTRVFCTYEMQKVPQTYMRYRSENRRQPATDLGLFVYSKPEH